jgi:hypothetical protein
VQQATDEGRLAIVDAPAREEPEQVLVLVLLQVGQDVGGDEVGLVAQK